MTPFQTINEAVKTTGLSAYYLRNGCRDGSVPHIKSGSKYLINVPALLRKHGVPGVSEGDFGQFDRA